MELWRVRGGMTFCSDIVGLSSVLRIFGKNRCCLKTNKRAWCGTCGLRVDSTRHRIEFYKSKVKVILLLRAGYEILGPCASITPVLSLFVDLVL